MLAKENLVDQTSRTLQAIELLKLGAKPQFVSAETGININRIHKLFRDVNGYPPRKGQSPFSADCFVSIKRLNIDASLFINIHRSITSKSQIAPIDALIKSYKLYLEHVYLRDTHRELSFTRAWTLLRLIDAGMLCVAQCVKCGGKFVALPSVINDRFQCVFCALKSGGGGRLFLIDRRDSHPAHIV